MAVQAHTGLETQAVARCQTGQLHLTIVEERTGDFLGGLARDRDFKAILASVTTAREMTHDRLGIVLAAEANGDHGTLAECQLR